MQVNETQESKGAAITERLWRRSGDGVAEPSGRSYSLTRDQVEH